MESTWDFPWILTTESQVSGPVILPGTDHFRMLPLLGRTQRSGGRVSSREDRLLVRMGGCPLVNVFIDGKSPSFTGTSTVNGPCSITISVFPQGNIAIEDGRKWQLIFIHVYQACKDGNFGDWGYYCFRNSNIIWPMWNGDNIRITYFPNWYEWH